MWPGWDSNLVKHQITDLTRRRLRNLAKQFGMTLPL